MHKLVLALCALITLDHLFMDGELLIKQLRRLVG